MKNTKYIVLAAVAVIGVFTLGRSDNEDNLGASIIDTTETAKSTTESSAPDAESIDQTSETEKQPETKETPDQPSRDPAKRPVVPNRELTEDDMVELLEGLWGPSQAAPSEADVEEEVNEGETVDSDLNPLVISDQAKTEETEDSSPDKTDDSVKLNQKTTSKNDDSAGISETGEIIYEDGTYSVIGEYKSGNGYESIAVEITIEKNVVKSVKVVPLTLEDEERKLQEMFAKDVVPYVVGEKVADIPRFASVSGGSSVPNGFQDAVEKIQLEAKAAVQHKFKVIPHDEDVSDEMKEYLKQLEQDEASAEE